MDRPVAMSRAARLLLALLVASVFINYIDRANLSLAAPLLETELTLSPLQVGSLLGAFFWTYAALQLFGFAGWLADRFPVGLVFALSYFSWAIATIATGLLSTFTLIYAARLLLGAGESVTYPCYSKMFAASFAQHHRGRANALLDAGTKLGPALGTFLGGLLLGRLGWRMFFVVLGIASLLWLIPWVKLMPRSDPSQITSTQTLPTIFEMLKHRSSWGTFGGHFCGNYFWYFLLTWAPIYLVKERHFSIEQMANLTSIAFLVVATSTILAGWFSDRMIGRGKSPTVVRKSIVVGGLTLATVIFPVAFVPSVTTSMVLLMISCIGYGVYASNHWAITQTIAGPLMAGRWTSVQNGVGNISGIVGPSLAGWIVQTSGSSAWAFAICALVSLSGALLWGVVVGPVEQAQWSSAH